MNNSSVARNSTPPTFPPADFSTDRAVIRGFTSVLLVISFYITCALTVHGLREIKNRKIKSNELSAYDRVAGIIRFLCIFTSLLNTMRIIAEFLEDLYGHDPKTKLCSEIRKTKSFLLVIAITTAYFVLWIRQRNLYKKLSLPHHATKVVQVVSHIVLFLLVSCCAVSLFTFIGFRGYKGSVRGCVESWPEHWTGLATFVGLFVYTLVFQLVLLGLLLYPILRHWKTLKRMSWDQRLHIAVIKRVTFFTSLSIMWNGLVGVTSLITLEDSHSLYRHLLYDIDVMVLLICVVCSFHDWRARFFPWFVTNTEPIPTPETTTGV